MGASFSRWARWDDTVVQRVLASEAPPVQYSGPALFQGAQNLTINGGVFNMSNLQAASSQDPNCLHKVLDFLSLVNFRSIQQENLGKWTPGTIKWLLESSMFQWWLDTQCAILWGTGMPGAGKTILASVVIKHLEALAKASSDICIAFVYCRYTEPMKVRDVLAALVRQLLERFPRLLPVVEPLYKKHNLERTTPTQTELMDVIRKIFSRFRIAYLFIDGLDEALYDEQFDLLNTLKSVPANFFITSRPLVRLKDVLPNVEFFGIAAQTADIEFLVSQHINHNLDLQQVLAVDGHRERVIKKICESSQGMFLHASLMVEAVRHCTSSRHVMEQLDKLPAKLDVLYDEAFKRIEMQSEERAALAKRVLLWVTYAYSPLTVDDLRYAVASDPKVDWETQANLVPESLLVSVCCGLVTVEEKLRIGPWPSGEHPSNRAVRLIHYTALDSLKRIMGRWETPPHCLLAELCVERLAHCGIPRSLRQDQDERYFPQPPLVKYANNSWPLHAKESIRCPPQLDVRPVPSILRFFAMCTVFPTLNKNNDRNHFDDPSQGDTPMALIHLVVYYQLPHLLSLVHRQVNDRTKRRRSALFIAAWQNDPATAELLLEMDGIDMNLQDWTGETALMHAARRGSADTVKALLLDPRIDIHKRNNVFNRTALHCALQGTGSGNTEAALRLIATPGIDINAVDDLGRTPLMLAYKHPLKLLDSLAQHPDIDLLKRDNDGQTALMHACRLGTSSAVEWYLRLPGADAKDHSGASALTHRARYRSQICGIEDYLSDFRALVAAGLDVNWKDAEGFTAIMRAVQQGLADATRALLQLEGIDVTTENYQGTTLLMVACDAVLKFGSLP
ncbi:hypothetical protein BKA70DRAFT_625107 [Coprinopsis sp. MPI-PUGE-AT-0042]|nr:hypothetical protein BKA70DRAFT_625107 [Coprinopsis sp. MPI-PUGE-AT-0042]